MSDYQWEQYLLRELIRAWESAFNHSFEGTFSSKGDLESKAQNAYKLLLEEQQLPQGLHPASVLRAIDRCLADLSVYWSSEGQIEIDNYYILRQPEGWQSASSRRHIRHPNYWLRSHQILPRQWQGLNSSLKRLKPSQALETSKPIRIWATGFEDNVEPDWVDPPPYYCVKLTDSEQRDKSVNKVLRECKRHKVNILVLPELTVDRDVLLSMQEWLQDESHELKLVVAGSFHINDSDERRNRSVVLDGFGEVVMMQDKLLPMAYDDSELGEVEEAIVPGNALHILATQIGSIVVSICRDFLESAESGAAAAQLLAKVAPNVVFVPSMGSQNTNEAHERRAKKFFQKFSTRTLVASQPPDLDKTTDRPCGIACFGKASAVLSPTSEEKQPGILVEFDSEHTRVLPLA